MEEYSNSNDDHHDDTNEDDYDLLSDILKTEEIEREGLMGYHKRAAAFQDGKKRKFSKKIFHRFQMWV